MRHLLLLAALFAVCLAHEHHPKAKQEPVKHVGRMGKKHAKVMSCFKACMKDLDSLSDKDVLKCYQDHLSCMQGFTFKHPMYSQMTSVPRFKRCFATLEECARDADDSKVEQCAADMKICMVKTENEKPNKKMSLPMHIKTVVKRYQVCSKVNVDKASCIRKNIASMSKMHYGMQVSECINRVFLCQSKEGSQATECLNELMDCQRSITRRPTIEETDPMAKIANKIHACFNGMEQRHGTISDEDCIQEFSTCILDINIPMVPPIIVKHGYCFKGLKDCSSDASAANVKICMNTYRGCLGPMMTRRKSRRGQS